jgi:hypothetical protein
MSRFLIALVATTLLVGVATTSFATQVIQRTPQELAQDSELVVDGKVSSVRSYWNDDHSKILTEAVLAVGSTYKGGPTPTVRIVQLGGVVGNVRMTAHGALAWKPGEEVLVFLEPSFPGAFQIAGFSQGKFLIERDPRTGKAFINRALPADMEGKTPSASSSLAAPQKVTLEQFVNSVLPKR